MANYGYVGLLESIPETNKQLYKNAAHCHEQEEKLRSKCDEIIIEKTFRKKAIKIRTVGKKQYKEKNEMDIDRLINKLTDKDSIVICNLIYLARNIGTLLKRLQRIEDKNITLEIIDLKENSLNAHAKAIMEFNKFVSGSNISKGIRQRNFNKSGNLDATHNRSIIKNWRLQHEIKVKYVKGELTVTELAKEYCATRQTIYRILKKKEFEQVTEHLPMNYENWNLDECKKRVKVNAKEVENNKTAISISLGNCFHIDSWDIKTGSKATSKIRSEFLEKTDHELKEIFYNLTKGKYL